MATQPDSTEPIDSEAEIISLDDLEETSSSSGLGAESAGQSGDTQGLDDLEESNSESVKELLEEGQYYEASVVSGIENVPSAEDGPIRTRQVREDDVPPEYLEGSEFRK